MNLQQEDLKIRAIEAHKFSVKNKESIRASDLCGCFYCLKIFPALEVEEYVDYGETPVCPYCKNDSIICDKDVVFSKELLKTMKKYWFQT